MARPRACSCVLAEGAVSFVAAPGTPRSVFARLCAPISPMTTYGFLNYPFPVGYAQTHS